MAFKILILGASYGSLLGTKLAMAGHDATLVCRTATAQLINAEGTDVRIKLRDEDLHRHILSGDLKGKITACTPEEANPADFDLVALAMQEPQYSAPELHALMQRVAAAEVPCLSIMNMPPPPFLARIDTLASADLSPAYKDMSVWENFKPGLMSLCSPDPQAFRPPEEKANVLHVGLPTNFKAASFEDPKHTAMLETLASDMAAVTLDGKDVPVKLRVYDSLFVPLAKWSMLLTGNYRCILANGERAIGEAVHGDADASAAIYAYVDQLAQKLGADAGDQVPFAKYAKAAESLLKPSSAARAIAAGAKEIERVDRLVMMIGQAMNMRSAEVENTVALVDARLETNRLEAIAAE